MSPVLWVIVALFIVSAVLTVTQIGKPRRAVTPGMAGFIVVVDLVLVGAILVDRGVIRL